MYRGAHIKLLVGTLRYNKPTGIKSALEPLRNYLFLHLGVVVTPIDRPEMKRGESLLLVFEF